MSNAETQQSTVLVLRYIRADRTSYGGYGPWPESGPVECPDWRDNGQCGGGFHGWLGGEGNASVWDHRSNNLGLVLAVGSANIRNLSGKVKFPRGTIVYSGTRAGAADYLLAHGCAGRAVIGAVITAGYNGQATAGNNGQATAGNYGQATAGYNGQATAGNYGQATAGYNGQATAGYNGKATAGSYGQATAGSYGQATAGYNGKATTGNNGQATAGSYGQATAGYNGKATAGYNGKATAGNNGQATAGDNGQATAGNNGTIQLSLWDGPAQRRRIKTAYVGEGIEPNVPYRLNSAGNFVKVTP